MRIVRASKELAQGAAALAGRCLDFAGKLVAAEPSSVAVTSGGRKGHPVMADPVDQD